MARKPKPAPAAWRSRIVGHGEESADKLLANPANWRKHPKEQAAALTGVLEQVGWVQDVIINRTTGRLVDGHLRVELAKAKGEAVPVVYVELTEEEERLILASLDPLAGMAERDEELWRALVSDLHTDNEALEALLRSQVAAPAYVEGEDDAPEPPEAPVTVLGDLWRLGEHRVLCGDSTATDATVRVFGGRTPDLCVTDPPYGINIVKTRGESKKGVVGGAKPYGKSGSEGVVKKGVGGGANIVKPKLYAQIANDDGIETARQFYRCACDAGVENYIVFGGNYFTDFLPASPCWVIWDKQNSGNFADVEMAWTSYGKGSKLYRWMWNGLSRAGDRKTELLTRVHPTQKPVGLMQAIFADFPGDVVYDAFLGSGSTLIACEKTGRTCYGMELSPAYVDVIVRRWEAFTGREATLEGSGCTFAHVKFGRRLGAEDAIKDELEQMA